MLLWEDDAVDVSDCADADEAVNVVDVSDCADAVDVVNDEVLMVV